jgi:ABC-type polysaccharide/polyol phosphate export permease
VLATLRSLYQHRRLVRSFVLRDLRARYVGSTMGFFWSVIFPIVNLFVFMFVFRLLLNQRFGPDMGPKQTAIFMLAGILVWSAFAEALARSTNCLVENANLIQKVVFPSEILPLNLALSSVVNMLIGLPIVLIGNWVVKETDAVGARSSLLAWPMLCIPLLIVLQVAFTVGLGYLLAALNALWRDTYHLVGVAVQVWMFCTPIFYPKEFVLHAKVPRGPLNEDGFYTFGWLLEVNPMHWLIETWRRVLLQHEWPDWHLVLRFAAVAAIVFALGSTFFHRQKRSFPDLL